MRSRTSRRCSSRSSSSRRSTSSPFGVLDRGCRLRVPEAAPAAGCLDRDDEVLPQLGGRGRLAPAEHLRRRHHHRPVPRHRNACGLCARALQVPGSQPLPARDREHPRVPAHHHRGSACRDLPPRGNRRHRLRRRARSRRLHAAAHGAHHGERLRRNLVRARGGGDDARLQPASRRFAKLRFPSRFPGSQRRRSSSS